MVRYIAQRQTNARSRNLTFNITSQNQSLCTAAAIKARSYYFVCTAEIRVIALTLMGRQCCFRLFAVTQAKASRSMQIG